MVEEYTVVFAINLFRRHEFSESILAVAVDTAD